MATSLRGKAFDSLHLQPSSIGAEEDEMARGEQRGNREAKKPKQDKPKSEPVVSPFTVVQSKPGGKKK
jgi:hypothetical protein